MGDGLGELGLAGARRAVEQGVDAGRALAGRRRQHALQAQAVALQVGEVRQGPGGRGSGLDDHRQQRLGGLRRQGQDLGQQVVRGDEVLQVVADAGGPQQAELAQRAVPAEGPLELGDRQPQRAFQEGVIVAHPAAAGLAQEVAEQGRQGPLLGEIQDQRLDAIEAGTVGDQPHGRVGRLRAVLRREPPQQRAGDLAEQAAQVVANNAPRQAGEILAARRTQKRRQPAQVEAILVLVGGGGGGRPLGVELGQHRRVEQRQALDPQRAEEVRILQPVQHFGRAADQLQHVAPDAAGFGCDAGEIATPGGTFARCTHGHSASEVQVCRRRLSTCHTMKSPRCGPSSMKTPSAMSRGSRKYGLPESFSAS